MVSAKPWSIDAVARLFLGVIASVCFGVVLAGMLESKKTGFSADQREFLQMTILIVSFQGAALVWMAVFLRHSKISWRDAFGLCPPSRFWAMAAGLGIGLLVVPAVWALQLMSETVIVWLGMRPVTQVVVEELQKGTMSMPQIILFGVFTILLAPVAEEALFRGILYPAIKQTGHPRWALWGSSVFFGIAHFNLETLAPLVCLAVLLVFLYEASGSLLTPIATHAMFNAANFYLVVSDNAHRLSHVP
jgi:membrane protease YdiL (CAAX protease family)